MLSNYWKIEMFSINQYYRLMRLK